MAQKQKPPVEESRAKAPVRTQQFVYGVKVGTTRYTISLNERLPSRGGRVDVPAAQQALHDLLLHNRLVEPGGKGVRAQVIVAGPGPAAEAFNKAPANVRLDRFRDAYLARTSSGGEFEKSPDVRIADASAPGAKTAKKN
jgi:hypothetical protein